MTTTNKGEKLGEGTTSLDDTDIGEIDAAIAAANARKAAKGSGTPKATDEEKAAKKAAKSAAKPAHMGKVDKAAERLAPLSAAAQLLFAEATAALTGPELAAFALHVQHHNRASATERSLTAGLTAGQPVRIVAGDPRYIGKVGTVAKSARIRCYVSIPGSAKELYLFCSDVTLIADDTAINDQKTG